jgi:hypothetical protein
MEELIIAVRRNNLDKVKRLINNGVDVNGAEPKHGRTPLYCAVENVQNVNDLSSPQARINAKKHNEECLATIKYLVKKGALIDKPVKDGMWTPFMKAVDEGELKIIKYFVKKGADPFKPFKNGQTAIDISYNDTKVLEYFLKKHKAAKTIQDAFRKSRGYAERLQKQGYFDLGYRKGLNAFGRRKKGSCGPSNTKLYFRLKKEVKRKAKVWPSAYASGQLVKKYKKQGGTYSCKKKNVSFGQVERDIRFLFGNTKPFFFFKLNVKGLPLVLYHYPSYTKGGKKFVKTPFNKNEKESSEYEGKYHLYTKINVSEYEDYTFGEDGIYDGKNIIFSFKPGERIENQTFVVALVVNLIYSLIERLKDYRERLIEHKKIDCGHANAYIINLKKLKMLESVYDINIMDYTDVISEFKKIKEETCPDKKSIKKVLF